MIFNRRTKEVIGRSVVYTGNRNYIKKFEEGVVTSFNKHYVFVRFGTDKYSKAVSPEFLEWSNQDARDKS